MPKPKKTTGSRGKTKAPKKTAPKNKKAVKKPAAVKARKKTAGKSAVARKTSPAKTKRIIKKPTMTSVPAKTKMSKVTPINVKLKQQPKRSGNKESFTPYKMKSGEEYTGPEQVIHFRQILLNWKRDLMEEVDRTVHHMRDEASNFPDPNDRATQEEEFALELRTRDRERKLIKKIDESLSALESGDYGYCEICGVEIGVRRLEARPTATLCIDCKTLDEIKERQLG